jgi:hypothetical protein
MLGLLVPGPGQNNEKYLTTGTGTLQIEDEEKVVVLKC